jgi:hypothetical protein
MCPYGKLLDGTPKISTALAPMTAITGWTELRTGTHCIFPVGPLIFKRFEEFESPNLLVGFPVISEIFWVPSGKCQGGPYEKTKRERWGEGGRHPLGVVRILVGGCYQPRKWEFTSKHQHLSQLMMESGLSQYHDWRNPFDMGDPWLVYAGLSGVTIAQCWCGNMMVDHLDFVLSNPHTVPVGCKITIPIFSFGHKTWFSFCPGSLAWWCRLWEQYGFLPFPPLEASSDKGCLPTKNGSITTSYVE